MKDLLLFKLKEKKRQVFISAVSLAIAITGFSLVKTFSEPADASSENLEGVQSASGFSKTLGKKAIPDKYNGKVQKVVYLTFDDGPSEYQEEILDILKQYKVPATFFMVGANIPHYEKSVKRLVKEGHYPGLHSMSHDYKKLYTEGKFVDEMKQVQDIMCDVTGLKVTLTRSPYGSMPGLKKELRDKMVKAGLKEWDWTVDSLDWKMPGNPNGITNNVLKHSTDKREIILLHEKSQTVEALPKIIKGLKSKGYEFEVYDESSHFPVNFWHDKRL